MWKFLSHFPLLLSLSYPFFMRFEIDPYISDTNYRPPCGCWCLDRHANTKEPKRGGEGRGVSPAGPVIGLHCPGNKTSLISIPAWHKPGKSCHLITTERVREEKELWGRRCKKGRKARIYFYLSNKIQYFKHLETSIITSFIVYTSKLLKNTFFGNVHVAARTLTVLVSVIVPLSHNKYRTTCVLFHSY